MTRFFVQFSLIFCVLLESALTFLSATPVQAADLPSRGPDFAPITIQIQDWVSKGYYPGASMIVVKDDKVLYQKYFGNYTPGTVTYIASAGKWLAAATIASVVDSGKLSWDDKVSKWLPEFTDLKGTATLRQLLSHTSGYPDYQPATNHPDNYQTLTEAVSNIVPLTPDSTPGEKFHYGGLAMQVAGRMAEKASGKTWEELFQQNIAGPCQMTDTHFTPVDPGNGHSPMLAGGARTTLADYAHFLAMISHDGVYQGKRILSVAAIQEMQADQVRGAKVTPGAEFVEKVRGETYNGIYGLGEWRERLNSAGKATLISSPSWAGAYPWIDKTHHLYGFFLTHVDTESPAAKSDHFNSFYASPVLTTLVNRAIDDAPPPNVKSGYADVAPGVHLFYEEAGKGQAVILLHAHSLDRREWDPQFAELAKHYRVIRYDLRGYGRSSLPVEGKEFTHAEDLLRLMQVLHVPKAHLVGLSLGSLVITDFLALHPDKILSATVASGALHDRDDAKSETPIERDAREAAEETVKLSDIAKLKQQGVTAYKEGWLDSLMTWCGPHRIEIRPKVQEIQSDWSAWQPLHIEAHLFLDFPVAPILARSHTKVPVLILIGRDDIAGSQKSSLSLLKVIPNAHLVYLENAGHLSNMETPGAFNHELESFLASVPRR